MQMTPNRREHLMCWRTGLPFRDLRWLEERVNRNLIKFNTNKCKVLHLDLNNLKQQHRVGTDWQKKNLGIWETD